MQRTGVAYGVDIGSTTLHLEGSFEMSLYQDILSISPGNSDLHYHLVTPNKQVRVSTYAHPLVNVHGEDR